MKNIFNVIIIVIIFSFMTTLSYAAATDNTGSITLGANGPTVDLSANVHAAYASADGSAYSTSTYNDKGSQTYLTGSWTTYIYYKDGTSYPTTFNGNSGDEPSTGWTVIGK